MRHTWRLVLIALAVIAAACSGDGDDDAVRVTEIPATTGESASEPSLPGPASFDKPPSAIYQRNDPAFPEPLIDISRLESGGVPPDGITPVDRPKYVSPDQVDFLLPQDAVLVLDIDGDVRAFPAQIMIWHEIVNTEVGGIPVTVSYCPLCNSAVAYDRRHPDGTVMDFGTSGLLYNSALVMYDRQTATLWTHIDGKAVHGVLAGTELELFPVATTSFEAFAEAHPDGLVLSRDTGLQRNYGANPYPGYDGGAGLAYEVDFDRSIAPGLTRLLAVRGEGETVAVFHDLLSDERVVDITVDGVPIVTWLEPGAASPLQHSLVPFGRDVGSTGAFVNDVEGDRLTFSPLEDGGFTDAETGSTWNVFGTATEGELAGTQLEAAEHLDTFWFTVAAYSDAPRLIGLERVQGQ